MNNINENLKPKQEVVQIQNVDENKKIEELKREMRVILNILLNIYLNNVKI